MRYKPGQSGNPDGRPKGGINKRTELAKLLEPHAEELVAKTVELAKGGEINALRICIERLIPRIRESAIQFELPAGELSSTKTLLNLGSRIIESVANGQLTLEQAQKFTSIVDAQRKTIEIAELSVRVKEIEHVLKVRSYQC